MEIFGTIIPLLLLSAFFSGCEMAYLSVNKLLLEINRVKHPQLSKIIDVFIQHPGVFISTMLIGNNIALVLYGLKMAELLNPALSVHFNSDFSLLLIQTIVSTIIILITAEFLPKTLFRLSPVFVLNTLAVPIMVFYLLLYPLSKLTIALSNLTIKLLIGKKDTSQQVNPVFGRTDLDNLLMEHEEQMRPNEEMPQEVRLMRNALDFSSIKIRECTIPRTDLEAVELGESIDELTQRFIETGYSKIMVYKETIDNIIGYVHVSEIFKHPTSLRQIINPISVVPETMTANKVLEIFTREHKSIALVVDEFGGTSGIVTMEDILEEIFGEIDDEHDVSDLVCKQLSDTEFLFSGKVEVDNINEAFGLELPFSDEYETIAGFILFFHESIPDPNEVIRIDRFEITIESAANNRIDLVRLRTFD
jgi:CBS domain containing-hemolysin-like protein